MRLYLGPKSSLEAIRRLRSTYEEDGLDGRTVRKASPNDCIDTEHALDGLDASAQLLPVTTPSVPVVTFGLMQLAAMKYCSLSARTDAALKIASVDGGFAGSDEFHGMVGFDEATIAKLRSERRRKDAMAAIFADISSQGVSDGNAQRQEAEAQWQ